MARSTTTGPGTRRSSSRSSASAPPGRPRRWRARRTSPRNSPQRNRIDPLEPGAALGQEGRVNLSAFIRSGAHLRPKDLLRAGSGALFGVAATGVLARAVMNGGFDAAVLLVP